MIEAIVVYDVRTDTPAGARRLRVVAKHCEGIGNRVQYSVFELRCEHSQFIAFIKKIEDTIATDDSVRIYRVPAGTLGNAFQMGRPQPARLPGAVVW